MEIAVATLATDRALLLLGLPGTAKTWVSEHLAAAISGDSTLLVQGTAGTAEEAVRYGWNYARLLAEGPSPAALVPSPVYRAMESGAIVRVEELTRMPSDVQDALITVLSEKSLPVPELGTEVLARHGFNLIATANDRDRGVNELSSALRRRFNTVVLPTPATAEEEVRIVTQRVAALGAALALRLTTVDPAWLQAMGDMEASFFMVALFVSLLAAHLQLRSEELRAARSDVQELSKLFPVCAWCRKVKAGDGYWQQIEAWLAEHREMKFTHSICESCEQEQLAVPLERRR